MHFIFPLNSQCVSTYSRFVYFVLYVCVLECMLLEKRRKLQKQAEKVRTKLGLAGSSTLTQVTSIMTNYCLSMRNNNKNEKNNSLHTSPQQPHTKDLLTQWKHLRQVLGRRELTDDQIVLPEGLRRELETLCGTSHPTLLVVEN